MKNKILIVEDQFVEANNLQMILERAGYEVCPIARSVSIALEIIEKEKPDLVLLDIFLKGKLTGIDLAKILQEQQIAFVYLSANSNKEILDAAKATKPYGFLVKPFREKDVLVTLDIANYLHEHNLQSAIRQESQQAAKQSFPTTHFKDIIGKSRSLDLVLNHVQIVAPTNTSVLLLGESGTGKERIADAIHLLSSRKSKPLIKVNCAALPASLIESELFGHEKGAFTGATEKRIGKFEQAQGGTIFLDEIGEMPLDLQVKLLRVLQEKEIERVGGRTTFKVDVRIIAATNRNLEKEVAEGRFRMDLYYRLNVFPIVMPPLRERKEDIPLLAQYFLEIYTRKIGKQITGLSDKVLEALVQYSWPGNIRELEHFIERAVLLTQTGMIQHVSIPVDVPKEEASLKNPQDIKSMEEMEREHILWVLEQCNGKVFGPGGAAELLKVPVSTLNSRMKKLGIEKENFFSVNKS
ncbi:sigma-54 dependent transcriptional regulator [Cytophagaceae bacterium YF14B1]|uniref:Sigma-54 dependent transcriptional regulator n=1 Tax=Xanthocytophaga flava TaxID=3048013 RepID=A0AAE3U9W0_9BACT|nr:sigma-54 dependent transcriptional regulator [Xanthocytophaga flavus]MDJ1482673.1 sigma-54 dependent transcriptional regulator [Xanthocytophaga flavus]